MIPKSLTSIIVITYNSQDFILETLESIKNQTYLPIELIISDDGSQDNTIQICNNWLNENVKRFSASKIITTAKNSGIPANCNRGIIAAKGDWIKLLAGDDVLLPLAIETYIDFTELNTDCEIIHSKVIRMVHKGDQIDFFHSDNEIKTLNQRMAATEQLNLLKFSSMVKAPSVIIKKSLLASLSYLDESIKLCEDWPFWLKLTASGKKFYFINEELVFYRIHDNSVYSGLEKKFVISPFYLVEVDIYKKYIKKIASPFERLLFNYYFCLKRFFFKFNDNPNRNLFIKIYQFFNIPYKFYAKYIFIKNYK